MIAGILLALLTSASWAVGNVCVQRCGRSIGAPRALLWALGTGGLGAGLLSFWLDHPTQPITQTTLLWTALAAGGGLLAYACLFYALAHARLTLAVPLISSWSLFAVLFSMAAFGDRLRGGQLVGALGVFAGVVCVARGGAAEPGRGTPPGHPIRSSAARWALLAALGSGVGFGLMVPLMAVIAPALGEFRGLSAIYAGGIVLALPVALLAKTDLRPPPLSVMPLVLLTGLVETSGFVAVTFARRFAPAAVVSPVASLAAAFTVLYAWLVLRERPRRIAMVGAALASLGVVVLAL